jgi:hypothetical protein
MKKIILTLAFALTAALTAQAQPVYSNVVGMVKTTIADGEFEIVSLQFPGEGTGVKLLDAFTGVNDLSVVYVWDANQSEYNEFTFYQGDWYNKFGVITNNLEITQGQAVWIKDGGGGANVVHSGVVPEVASVNVPVSQGYNLIANPYPVSLKLSDISVGVLSNFDKVYSFSEGSYAEYTWYNGDWYDTFGTIVNTKEFVAGKGVWLELSGVGGTLSFSKPY